MQPVPGSFTASGIEQVPLAQAVPASTEVPCDRRRRARQSTGSNGLDGWRSDSRAGPGPGRRASALRSRTLGRVQRRRLGPRRQRQFSIGAGALWAASRRRTSASRAPAAAARVLFRLPEALSSMASGIAGRGTLARDRRPHTKAGDASEVLVAAFELLVRIVDAVQRERTDLGRAAQARIGAGRRSARDTTGPMPCGGMSKPLRPRSARRVLPRCPRWRTRSSRARWFRGSRAQRGSRPRDRSAECDARVCTACRRMGGMCGVEHAVERDGRRLPDAAARCGPHPPTLRRRRSKPPPVRPGGRHRSRWGAAQTRPSRDDSRRRSRSSPNGSHYLVEQCDPSASRTKTVMRTPSHRPARGAISVADAPHAGFRCRAQRLSLVERDNAARHSSRSDRSRCSAVEHRVRD